jgi:type II secretory pathway component PulF
MMIVLNFVVIFIVPKFEKIFLDFKMKLPAETEMMIFGSRWLGKYWYIPVFAGVLLIVAANLLVLSSRFRWYFPFVGGFYRQHARGHFLHVLGLMMETGRPLPQILGCLVESRFLPTAIADRVHSLMYQVQQGEPFADSLVRCGLAAKHQYALIVSAQKAQNLPWALQSLGDSLIRRSAQMSHRISMIVFPILVLACAGLVAFVAIALFSPMIELLEGLHGKI